MTNAGARTVFEVFANKAKDKGQQQRRINRPAQTLTRSTHQPVERCRPPARYSLPALRRAGQIRPALLVLLSHTQVDNNRLIIDNTTLKQLLRSAQCAEASASTLVERVVACHARRYTRREAAVAGLHESAAG